MEKTSNRKWIIGICLGAVFSFFAGYYFSYRINEKEKSKLEIIQEIMENEWYYGIDDENIENTLQEKMILGVMDLNKDPYTRYLTSLGTLADSYTGLGIELDVYGQYFRVSEVSSKTSIDDGVEVGDILLSINNVDLKNKDINELNSLVGDGNVSLKVLRNNNEILINTRVTSYDPITVFTKEYGDSVSYLRISEFNLDTASYVKSYFDSLPVSYTKLVIDLRGNPGGYISAVNEVLDLFVTKNKVAMTTIDKHGNKEVTKTKDDSCYIFHNIYVLIDSDSASGAEALAAALDYHLEDVVTLYGETTFGKGSAQTTYYFKDGTYFHYTYALWYTPQGVTINHVGIDPEVNVENENMFKITLYNKELELYDYGVEVESIQKILTKLGYYNEERIHGFVDEIMVEAIEDFQEDNGLTISGKIDRETLRHLAKLLVDDRVSFENEVLDRVVGELLHE